MNHQSACFLRFHLLLCIACKILVSLQESVEKLSNLYDGVAQQSVDTVITSFLEIKTSQLEKLIQVYKTECRYDVGDKDLSLFTDELISNLTFICSQEVSQRQAPQSHHPSSNFLSKSGCLQFYSALPSNWHPIVDSIFKIPFLVCQPRQLDNKDPPD